MTRTELGGTGSTPSARPARPDDAPLLVELANLAGEGLPLHLWAASAETGQTALDAGIERARRETGGFSYRNAVVIEAPLAPGAAPEVAGMLVGYRQDAPFEAGDLAELPATVRPLVELEAEAEAAVTAAGAPGSWYVNVLAVLPAFQRRGLGSRLLDLAEEKARETGAAQMSLIVDSSNLGAFALYLRHGYIETARRPLVPWPDGPTGEWVLLLKAL
ncbi:GNAT family N-acetyltransferase [Algihabitans albus]|uniref:GNAT family N-acetyltransferase n=1 Tax=Algihabitans albus TaxID=2164067 RepID=UPI000E5C6B4E|nr:N-acetyltransferase [Algihabitans albus]